MANRKNKYDAAHLRNLARYQAQVDAIYRSLTKEAAAIASGIDTEMPEDLFSFSDYPKTMKRVDTLIEAYKADMMKVVVNGVKSEWTLANNKNNEIARQVFGDRNGKLTTEQERRYYKNNDTARQAFLDRKERGLNLSDRVWDYSGKFRKEIEMGVDLCLRKGMPAAEMARELQKYLKHPDELYRRVRDQHGNLTLSKAAKDFHPGRGVYRSSYKNALRLAITETNMAYRLADWERWQQMDFVVGIRIQLSNNHTCLGKDGEPHPFHDICDELAGEYPKSFKWVGWHPQCRCNAGPILKTVDEKIADNMAKRNGGKASTDSVNSVKRMPKAFNDWLKDNMIRAERSFSVPYFIKDNPQFLPKNYINLYSMRMPYDTYEEYTKAMIYNRKNEDISNAQRKNINELNKVLPVVRGKIMDFKEADEGRVNPKFNTEDADKLGYRHNCQTCTVAYELRRRGFDLEAMPAPKGGLEFWEWWSKQGLGQDDIFLDTAGKPVKFIYKSGLSNKVLRSQFIEEQTTTVGRYEVYCEWKPDKSGKRGAHVFIVERQKNGNLLWFDPQSGEVAEQFRTRYLSNMAGYKLGVRRIDDKLVNPKMASRFIRKASQ